MKVELSVKKTQKGTLGVLLTEQDIYNLLEEKGVFLDLEESVLQSSEFEIFRQGFDGIFCKLSWEFEE